jgi:hypothetical protein
MIPEALSCTRDLLDHSTWSAGFLPPWSTVNSHLESVGMRWNSHSGNSYGTALRKATGFHQDRVRSISSAGRLIQIVHGRESSGSDRQLDDIRRVRQRGFRNEAVLRCRLVGA